MGFAAGSAFGTSGFENVAVKGDEIEFAVAEPWVPPKADTAFCLPFTVGAVSSTNVNVGLVNPVCAPPVVDESGDHVITKLRREMKRKNDVRSEDPTWHGSTKRKGQRY
jgi:hypothetical protein